ncbi:MAG: hypothetical protein LBQ90_05735 [Synergistaceae bacterium]|nr:hypothetical protein [Synergistaceae bacterium]
MLCPREILSQDRDRAVNGGYVLPGGRMDIKDLEGISEGEAMRFVYGIPDAPSEVSEKQLDNAFCKTLERELREELDDLRHGEDYEIEGHGDLEPYIGVYGASDRRVETETRIRLFTIRLKPSGILKLARGTGEERHGWQWVRRNDLGKEMASGRAFLAAFRSDWNCFYDPSKSEDVERAFKGNGNVQAVILPLTQEEKLTLVLRGNHKREIALPDENSVRLLLYLGWSARGFFCDEEGGNRHIGWGWVEFNDVYKDAAENLKRYLKEAEPEHDILLFCEGKCRLFQPSKEIYFSPALFEGWLSIREGENGNLQLFRKGKRLPGLCIWKETAKDFPLSESATKNLKALNDKNDVNHETLANDAHDVLNNVSPVASSQTLTEAVRSLGLRQLYASTKGKYAITIPLNTNEEAAKL